MLLLFVCAGEEPVRFYQMQHLLVLGYVLVGILREGGLLGGAGQILP